MGQWTQYIKERDGFGNAIFPGNLNGFQTSGTVDMSVFQRVNFVVLVGVEGTAGTVAAGLQTGNNANGSDGTNFAAATLPTNIGVNNQQATFEFQYGSTELAGARYVRGWINMITIQSNVAGIIYGTEPRYPPQNADNATMNTRVVA
jgi:hypothetical protein